ncbi:hypothetical protein MMC25_000166 [Agyrium rufum]|nr:hypothetical protein [Agyrium rufum]
MASQVTVIDARARRAVVKVTPGTYLTSVLEEVCQRMGLDASQYGMKNNNKVLDLSRTFRLSGLTSGAKLELVLQSRSPTVVSVALQVPDDTDNTKSVRLTEKFSSTTSLWQVLRQLETASTDGTRPARNLTARGVPRFAEGDSGGGTLCHEKPVLQIMGREISSLSDYQKTLGQLGFNNGSVVLRLNYRQSEQPLQSALEEMEEYLKPQIPPPQTSLVPDSSTLPQVNEPALATALVSETSSLPPPSNETADSTTSDAETQALATSSNKENSAPITEQPTSEAIPEDGSSGLAIAEEPQSTPTPSLKSGFRPVQVFAPPSGTAPQAARTAHNDADYEPTVEHAKAHQAALKRSTLNKRLPTDAEIAEQEAIQLQKLTAISSIEIKVRLPDQSSLVATFRSSDTSGDLYTFVEDALSESCRKPFLLSFFGLKGRISIPMEKSQKLISGLGMAGKVLVNFSWDGEAVQESMKGMTVLKEEFVRSAKPLEVKEVESVPMRMQQGESSTANDKSSEKRSAKDGGRSGPMPKWFKGLGKK